MAFRFTDTEIYSEDWFCSLGGEYQLLFKFICDKCDNAGIWKPNKNDFEIKTKFKINLDSFLEKVNGDKERILVLGNGRWFILGFIKFQWFNKKPSFVLNLGNKLHKSLFVLLNSNNIPLTKVRGLEEVLETSRERERDYIDNKGLSNNTKGEHQNFQAYDVPVLEIPHAPKLEKVVEYFFGQGITDAKEAEKFFNYYAGVGWRKGITPIFNWQSFANNWIANPKQPTLPQEKPQDTDKYKKLLGNG